MYDKDAWKKEIAAVLKKYDKIDDKLSGRLTLELHQGGVRSAILEKRLD